MVMLSNVWERGLTCTGVAEVIGEDALRAVGVVLLSSITLHERQFQTLGCSNPQSETDSQGKFFLFAQVSSHHVSVTCPDWCPVTSTAMQPGEAQEPGCLGRRERRRGEDERRGGGEEGGVEACH